MKHAIAVVGMACVYPDANSPAEMWCNVLAQRRAFRRIPPGRLRVENFFSEDRHAEDSIYATQAAVIANYEFNRDAFRIAEDTYHSTDLTHWLALDVATRALADAGFPGGEGLPRKTTGVLLGNTLTGEFSRANVLRLRWHYVRATAERAWKASGLPETRREAFFSQYETHFKAPFPPVNSDTLAGGLSNTIAGRICNYYDLKGGGYTVDGACASSLLAVANACSALAAGDLEVALAGGVDLSLDPFELIGFAKVGALATDAMRVYDVRSRGFWPGEGCGFLVLMPLHRALADQRRIYATIRGWGISSDGQGGLTRPEFDGQVLALQRAYARAGFGADAVDYFEGHGTGTQVGDATELRVLSHARQGAMHSAAIGSVKANIGHTKAAAGVAGLIKAILTVYHGILPPITGCEEPHEEFNAPDARLKILREPQCWPHDGPRRAAVSAMGFGGINSHVVIEGGAPAAESRMDSTTRSLGTSPQDAELFLFDSESPSALREKLEGLREIVPGLSLGEFTDLAASLAQPSHGGTVRAAIVAATPTQLGHRLEALDTMLHEGIRQRLDVTNGVFLSDSQVDARIGFLFPGQASPVYRDGGILARRFESVRELYTGLQLPGETDDHATSLAQPAIVAASAAGLRVLQELGIEASIGVGHSLGEITALCWAGAMDETALLEIATVRGRAMSEVNGPAGAMAAIEAPDDSVTALLTDAHVQIVGLNSPRQTVVAGEASAVGAMMTRARSEGYRVLRLPVSHAFHTPLMSPAMAVLAEALSHQRFQPQARRLISTVKGSALMPQDDLRDLLCRQLTTPVRFLEALRAAANEVDLLIEVGPGRVLTDLSADSVSVPAIALDACGASLQGLLAACGASFVLGQPLNRTTLFGGRLTHPFRLDRRPTFFANPCESTESTAVAPKSTPAPLCAAPPTATTGDAWTVVREVVAQQMKLPPAAVQRDSRMLSDLHLNSITVGQLVAESARRLGAARIVDPTRFANATVGQIADAFEELQRGDHGPASSSEIPSGIESWIEPFRVAWVERTRPVRVSKVPAGEWIVVAPAGHPLKTILEQVLPGVGRGVAVCLPVNGGEEDISLLLQGARCLAANGDPTHFVLVHPTEGAAAFARVLHREIPGVTTCVIDVPRDHSRAVEWIRAEVHANVGFTEVQWDAHGVRREPELQWLPLGALRNEFPVGAQDVVLVSGGGKGITAECALALARRTGAAVGILGRSSPSDDPELRQNLQRLGESGVRVAYVIADVSDADAVRRAVTEIEQNLGPITGIVHGAGRNVPHSLALVDEAMFRNTLAPKVHGLEHLLAAVPGDRLKLLVTFGSIIARIGMAGQADYAVANARLAARTERFHQQHPQCRCQCLEWSVWSGLGMGERLGRVEALLQSGVTPIPPDEGARLFCELIGSPMSEVSVVVAGRFGNPPTLRLDTPPLPHGRFLQQPRVHYPTELICDTPLSAITDPYADDHQLQGQRLFPAVLALEAMAQVAMALGRSASPPIFEQAQFHRPVVVPATGQTTVRIQALLRTPGHVHVTLLCSDTGFAVRHFEAVCRFDPAARPRELALGISTETSEPPQLDPVADIYEERLFHTGRFRRVRRYRRLTATECIAEISGDEKAPWFQADLPQECVLGDPGGRDAALHAIQACIPHRRILPIGVERMVVSQEYSPQGRVVWARERSHTADEFLYDVLVRDQDGRLLESWEGLRLRAVEGLRTHRPWPIPLLATYWERRLGELLPGAPILVAALTSDRAERTGLSAAALAQILGPKATVLHRSDGKPEAIGAPGRQISTAHSAGLTLAIASGRRVACDLETVKASPVSEWTQLLSSAQYELATLIARECPEDFNAAATRVWAAMECLKKAGIPTSPTWPLTLGAHDESGWVLLGSPAIHVATWSGLVKSSEPAIALVVLAHTDTREEVPQTVFEIRHVVTFEETNVVGNVYFVNHLSWQGRCRELFLRAHAPGAIQELDAQGLSLATSSVAVEYFEELFPFDEVVIRMSLKELTPSSASLVFDYLRQKEGSLTLMARGQHTVAVKRKAGTAAESPSGRAVFPAGLQKALEEYLPQT